MSRSEQREATRSEVLAAAEGLFLARGFEATTVRDIAEAAGVSVGTVMSVGDKRGLLAAVFERGIALVGERRAVEGGAHGDRPVSPSASPADRIVELVRPYVELFAARVDLARAYGAVLMDGAHGEGVFGALSRDLREEFVRVLTAPPSPHPAPEAAARAIHLVYLGTLLAWAGQPDADPEAALAAFRDAVAVVIEGNPA